MQEACVGEGLAVTTADVWPAVCEDVSMPSGVAETLFGLLGHLEEGHIGDLLRRHARKDGRVAVRWLVVAVNANGLPVLTWRTQVIPSLWHWMLEQLALAEKERVG